MATYRLEIEPKTLMSNLINRKAHCKIFHADKLEGNIKIFNCTNCKYRVGDENYFYEHKLKCKTGVTKLVQRPLLPKEQPLPKANNTVTLRFGQFTSTSSDSEKSKDD